jgi:hypothetical protein
MAIELRIAKLERRCRFLAFCLVGTLCMGGLLLLAGAAAPERPESLTTRKLEIVDEAGRVRMQLGETRDGCLLLMYDKDGKPAIVLSGDHSSLSLRKEDGKLSMLAGAGGASLQASGPKNTPALSLAVGEERATFIMRDRSGETVHRFETDGKAVKKDRSDPFAP